MKNPENFETYDKPGECGGETSVDTQAEVDLICGGIGFDEEPLDIKEIRKREKRNKSREE